VFVRTNFNVYRFFAGAFVPFWLLSREEVGAGAKLTYAMLAQQANSRGSTQLHFQVQASALGEDEGQLARYLMELEEVGLIEVSRGNVNQEDIRVFFPHHEWMAGLEPSPQEGRIQRPAIESAAPARLVPASPASAQKPLPLTRPVTAEPQASSRDGRGRRKRRRPQSKHVFEVCLQFVTYQKEVLQHDHIWNSTGLARHLHLSGEQDDEIDAWITEQASNAA